MGRLGTIGATCERLLDCSWALLEGSRAALGRLHSTLGRLLGALGHLLAWKIQKVRNRARTAAGARFLLSEKAPGSLPRGSAELMGD